MSRILSLANTILLAATVIAIGLVLGSSADAAFDNYNSVLIGEEAAGMGGAYTALARDSSAIAFYNPGALGFVEQAKASAGASVYKKFDVKYGDLDQFTTANLRVNQGFFRGVPSASGSILTYDGFNAAFSIVVPDYETFGGEIRSTPSQVSLLSLLDESLWVGAAMGRRLDENQGVGMTLYYTARNYSRTVRERLINGGTDAVVMSEEKNILSNSILAILGYQAKLVDGWRWGASLRLPSYQVSGTGSYFKSVLNTAPFSSVSENHANVATLTKIPAKLMLGAAWERDENLTLAADVSLYDQESYLDMTEPGTTADEITHRRIANLNLGALYKVNERLTLRAGAYTNFSSHFEPEATPTRRQNDLVDEAGWSANLAWLTQNKFTFTFGGYYSGGRGQSIQLLNQQLTRVPKSHQVYTMLIGTAFQL